MAKEQKTTIICDVCKKPIVKDVNIDIPWYCRAGAEKKEYYKVKNLADIECLYYCCSMDCVIKELNSRLKGRIVTVELDELCFIGVKE